MFINVYYAVLTFYILIHSYKQSAFDQLCVMFNICCATTYTFPKRIVFMVGIETLIKYT